MTSTASHFGFIYTIFGLGASHMGLWAGPEEKACPARPMGSSLRPNHCDHWQAALHCGHDKVVEMVLDAGANVNTQGGRDGNALQGASHRGHSHHKRSVTN